MKKSKSRGRRRQHGGPNREQQRQTERMEQHDNLKFYKTMCAALVRRAGGQMIIAKEEFEHMAGSLQWRKTEQGGIEFLFVGAEDTATEPGGKE